LESMSAAAKDRIANIDLRMTSPKIVACDGTELTTHMRLST